MGISDRFRHYSKHTLREHVNGEPVYKLRHLSDILINNWTAVLAHLLFFL
jgi:hypothetical protein